MVAAAATGTRATTSSTPRPAAGSTGPTPTRVSDRAHAARPRPVRHARLGQPLPRSPGRRPESTTRPRRAVMGLREGQVTVLIHSGSRGLGYQVCDDYLAHVQGRGHEAYGIDAARPAARLRARSHRPRGRRYLGAMAAAANYAWCNRQLLTHQAREVFARVFGDPGRAGHATWSTTCAHNIAKFEEHTSSTASREQVCVHRKGATRAFPPGHPEIPRPTRDRPAGDHPRQHGDGELGPGRQPRQHGARSFGTTCHGAGRHDEPQRRRAGQGRAAGSTRSSHALGVEVAAPAPQGARRGAAGGLQGRRPRRRRRRPGRHLQEGRPAAAGGRDQGLERGRGVFGEQ